ncbi:prepilin peptidase [Gilliamella sp. B2776]|uniref:prepilin peptidase n=1 Tax=unclassified Gilliamella TaxID=2685620 RepID=UPI002269D433|nr:MULTISPECIES: prepilin peptidase [unclassified Gilliamella]MCX8649067.1 prepilin peptidase [Gilliamella sp. B2779]MCX8653057.1 prepilin peptidase [Gilliamella sp. B2737]MCX8655317.1 prepilin peptidase [Gilliamella sp. B2894]MCX8664800.1 prepilin peptidase [Gilliamella sp. B2887]MCX8690879.1 prepilin peptidase [Gilliamella sp. B2776]
MINQELFNDTIILTVWLCLLISCYTDIKYRIISNYIVIVIFALAMLNYAFGLGALNYGASGIFLVCGLLMFYCQIAGAGDIKLITVLLITVPTSSIMFFLAVTTFLGLPLVIIAIIYKWLKKIEGGITLPYGVAITGGYILTSLTFFKVLI